MKNIEAKVKVVRARHFKIRNVMEEKMDKLDTIADQCIDMEEIWEFRNESIAKRFTKIREKCDRKVLKLELIYRDMILAQDHEVAVLRGEA